MGEATGAEFAVLERRVDDLEKRQDKLEDAQGKQWGRLDQQDRELVRIQVLMEGVGKTLTDVNTQLMTLQKSISLESTRRNNDWRSFFDKFFWVVVGAIVTYAVYKLSGH